MDPSPMADTISWSGLVPTACVRMDDIKRGRFIMLPDMVMDVSRVLFVEGHLLSYKVILLVSITRSDYRLTKSDNSWGSVHAGRTKKNRRHSNEYRRSAFWRRWSPPTRCSPLTAKIL